MVLADAELTEPERQLVLAASNGEATRKIKEGAVDVNGQRVTDVSQTFTVTAPTVLRLGRKYARLIP